MDNPITKSILIVELEKAIVCFPICHDDNRNNATLQ